MPWCLIFVASLHRKVISNIHLIFNKIKHDYIGNTHYKKNNKTRSLFNNSKNKLIIRKKMCNNRGAVTEILNTKV